MFSWLGCYSTPHSLSLCHPVTHTAREAWILYIASLTRLLPSLLREEMLIYIGASVCCCPICEITTSRHSLPKWFSFLLTHRHSHSWSNCILSIFLSIDYWFISLLLQIITNLNNLSRYYWGCVWCVYVSVWHANPRMHAWTPETNTGYLSILLVELWNPTTRPPGNLKMLWDRVSLGVWILPLCCTGWSVWLPDLPVSAS